MRNQFRHQKKTPSENMWRTLRIGVPIGALLMILLPILGAVIG